VVFCPPSLQEKDSRRIQILARSDNCPQVWLVFHQDTGHRVSATNSSAVQVAFGYILTHISSAAIYDSLSKFKQK
jgi:hypothetical protein